jgi:hypothetical protein
MAPRRDEAGLMFSTQRRRVVAWAVIAMLSTCLALSTLYAIYRTNQLVTTIQSCTQTTGECRKQNLRDSGRLIQRLVYSGICVDRPGTQTPRQVEKCVDKLMREAHRPVSKRVAGRP